ncbi:acylphosphatase [Sphingomonas sp. MMS24-J45]|uniref:acylphosphatase n=1 Tax=Sphingomonas sp. MMS24-J45 TaxID=3238806 RepID=UPI00384D1B43
MQRVFISGKVQRTGFRDWVVRRATDLGVVGWVRNLKDGRVELLVAGDDEATAALIEACHQGPPLARVDHVEARPDTERLPKGFTKRFTA